MNSVYVHPLALVESDGLGAGTRVWAFAQVMKGAKLGIDCNVGGHAFIESGAVIGDRVTIKNQVMIWDGVTIEDDVFIGPGVIFTNDRNPRSPRMMEVRERYARKENWLSKTLVKRGASIGAGAILVAGVTIGEYATIGAGAIVTKDVAPHSLMLGAPAKSVGYVCRCGIRVNPRANCETCGFVHPSEGVN